MLNTNFQDWTLLRLKKMERYFNASELLQYVGEQNKRPKRLWFWRIPQTLKDMTFGQRITLMMAYEQGDVFGSTYAQLTSVPRIMLPFLPIRSTFPFVAFVIEDLKRRAKRDEALVIPLTPEQKAAGLDKMNHGWFGVIDALVTRSNGRYDHSDIEKLPDDRVYRMRKIDVDGVMAQRRLIEQSNTKK